MSEELNCIVCQHPMVRIERPPHLPQDDLACDNRDCTMFTVVLRAAFVRQVHDAMALARAVEVLGDKIMDGATGYELRLLKVQGRGYALLCATSIIAPSAIVHGATPAAALIALAEQVNE